MLPSGIIANLSAFWMVDGRMVDGRLRVTERNFGECFRFLDGRWSDGRCSMVGFWIEIWRFARRIRHFLKFGLALPRRNARSNRG